MATARQHASGRSQRGAISPGAVIAILLLAVVAMGAIGVGRLAAVRMDAQNAADAAALAAADIIRQRGLPFDNAARASAEGIARNNSKLPITFGWNVVETNTSVNVTVTAGIDVELPLLVWNTGKQRVDARAKSQVPQTRLTDAERRLPKLVMALDYSGSMSLSFSGGGGQAIDVLESSVAGLLNAGLDIDYGAAFYSSSVFKTVPISSNAPNQIISAMNSYGAGGGTNTAAGITSAVNLLKTQTNTGYYILLVSDGEPNSMSAAQGAATAAWNQDVTIYTLEIRRSGSSVALSNFMTSVAGTPSSRGNPSYHFVATSAATLTTQFQNIVASIVCKAGPLAPAPSDPASVQVYLVQGGTERKVPAVANLVASQNVEGYQYSAADSMVRLTTKACDAVLDQGAKITVRYDRPSLTE